MSGQQLVRRVASDPFESVQYGDEERKPFWSIDYEDNKKVEEWLDNEIDFRKNYYGPYFRVQRDNVLIYKGIQWLSQDRYSSRFTDRNGVVTRKSPKVVINDIQDYIMQCASRLTRYKPAIAWYPGSNDYTAEQSADVAKKVQDSIWYEQKADSKFQDLALHLKIFGEAYRYSTWNPDKGPYTPEYKKQLLASPEGNPRIPLVDPETKEPVVDKDGNVIYIDRPVRIGDNEIRVIPPWHWLDSPAESRDKIQDTILWEAYPIEELLARYPEKAKEINESRSNSDSWFDEYYISGKLPSNYIVVFELWVKGSPFLEKGRLVRYIKGCVLENVPHPFSHKGLPYTYCQDYHVPGEIRGMSFIQQIYPIAHQRNIIASLILKSIILYAHPKILMPTGAVEIQQLINDSTLMTYSSDVPPSMMQMPQMTEQPIRWFELLGQIEDRLSGVFTMSRGEAPSGVRAAKALKLLEEQEEKRSYITITRWNNEMYVESAKMDVGVLADMMTDDDGRMAKILNKDHELLLESFKKADLNQPYEVVAVITTALSQSPSARIDDVIEIANIRLPQDGIFDKQDVIAALQLGKDDKMVDIATTALKTAEGLIDDLFAGKEIPEPTPDWDLVQHWKAARRRAQTRKFIEVLPPEIKLEFISHVKAIEYLMFIKAFGLKDDKGILITAPNLMLQQQMSQLDGYPMYFSLPSEIILNALQQPPMGGMVAPMPSGSGLPPQEPVASAGPQANPLPSPDSLPQNLPQEGIS